MTTPREAKSLAATVVRFTRIKSKTWETGIAVMAYAGTRDVAAIVDLDGNLVEAVRDYNLHLDQGCFTASYVVEFMEPMPDDSDVAKVQP